MCRICIRYATAAEHIKIDILHVLSNTHFQFNQFIFIGLCTNFFFNFQTLGARQWVLSLAIKRGVQMRSRDFSFVFFFAVVTSYCLLMLYKNQHVMSSKL